MDGKWKLNHATWSTLNRPTLIRTPGKQLLYINILGKRHPISQRLKIHMRRAESILRAIRTSCIMHRNNDVNIIVHSSFYIEGDLHKGGNLDPYQKSSHLQSCFIWQKEKSIGSSDGITWRLFQQRRTCDQFREISNRQFQRNLSISYFTMFNSGYSSTC